MLLKDKTASSIKRKVQIAKQQVDRNFSKADKVFKSADQEVDATFEKVQDLRADLATAKVRAETAGDDFEVATKILDIAVEKQGQVLDLIAEFEDGLDALLNA